MSRKEKLEEQIECLDKSLYEKWDVLDPQTEEGWDSVNNTDNCACCRAYRFNPQDCYGCPIHEDTGMLWCQDTPFDDMSDVAFEDTTEEERTEYFDKERQYLRDLKAKLEKELKELNDA